VSDNLYRGHRFPREIISKCLWHNFRFGVSFRDVEEIWRRAEFPSATKRSDAGARSSVKSMPMACEDGVLEPDKWHLDEVFLKINGVTHYLWRAVDQNGVVLDILVQPKRDRFATISDKYVAATHVNGALIGPTTLFPNASTPAAPGETVVLYGNGFGPTTPPFTPGEIVSTPATLATTPIILINNVGRFSSWLGARLHK
jgi:hypothetical protein